MPLLSKHPAPPSVIPSQHPAREHERMPVYRNVHWDHRSTESARGVVRDLTPGGTFLTPFGKNAGDIREGDIVWIVLELGGERESLAATVRWKGWSDEHDCPGFGLAFDGASRARAEELCLRIDAGGDFFVPQH